MRPIKVDHDTYRFTSHGMNYEINKIMVSHIHKVKIPKTVYGDPKSLSILLNYKPHCNAENPKYIISDEIASIMYTGGTMKRDNKNETHK